MIYCFDYVIVYIYIKQTTTIGKHCGYGAYVFVVVVHREFLLLDLLELVAEVELCRLLL